MALRLAGEEFSVVQGLDARGWLRGVTVGDSLPGLKIIQSGAGAGLQIANAAGVKATVTADGKARFGDGTAPTVSLEAASGLTLAAGSINLHSTNETITVAGNFVRITGRGTAGSSTQYLEVGRYTDGNGQLSLRCGGLWFMFNKPIHVGEAGMELNDYGLLANQDGQYISARNVDNCSVPFQARDNGVGLAVVARLQGAAEPRFRFMLPAQMYREAGDYGGNFATYTPPAGVEGDMIVAEDTNAGNPGRRIYVYSGGAWRYAALS